ncbi:hypothetical protein FNU76_22020 [Chitinimonas arctica]|uniref:HAF repeat-containing protein n=1 Tax=Chitinimonas arctica TaxID=2594795 RepID=A0A516SKX3_9NEIS|nr:hypothetical protein [Chitinimonas arctica]QDQ28812.1 hypothetical protein FNU76_22020 [Chitinimonas arctica]
MKSKWHLNLLACNLLPAVAILTVSAPAVAAEADGPVSLRARYTFVDLGTLGGSFSAAIDINNKRQVVGRSTRNDNPECDSSGMMQPCQFVFLWHGGKMTDLGNASPRGAMSQPRSINEQGVIVGDEEVSVVGSDGITLSNNRPFIYSHGAFRMLPLLASNSAYGLAYAVNGSGVVVGMSQDGDETQATVSWTGEKPSRGLVEAGIYRRGTAINTRGLIVGWQYPPASGRATNGFVQTGTTVINLSQPSSDTWSSAQDVNDAGVVVGNMAELGFLRKMATVWTPSNGRWVAKRIGALPGHNVSSLSRVNKFGDAVGDSYNGMALGSQRAVAVINGRLVDLTAELGRSDIVLTSATGINDSGDIVGSASVNGATRAFMLIRR